MTTVGYGDKTPKSTIGRVIAVSWMLASLVWVSLLSTSLVSRLTVERAESRDPTHHRSDRKKLAAVAQSSGAEYLDQHHLQYAKFNNLPDALNSLVSGTSDAVVNSVGALQYLISKRYASTRKCRKVFWRRPIWQSRYPDKPAQTADRRGACEDHMRHGIDTLKD